MSDQPKPLTDPSRTGGEVVFGRESIDPIPRGFQPFRKTQTTLACRIEGPFRVETRSGILDCADGWLAIDAHGWPYPIAANEFDKLYEPIDESG